MIVDRINVYASTKGTNINLALLNEIGDMCRHIFNRQFGVQEERTATISASNIGKCMRQNAYRLLNYPISGKEIDSRGKMVFFQGDMAEMAVVALAKQAGCDIESVLMDQAEFMLRGKVGHPDGILNHEDKKYILEVKSMTDYGFADFEKGEIDDSYKYQINFNMVASGIAETVVVALNKNVGVLGERVYQQDPVICADIYTRIEILDAYTAISVDDNPDELLPPRPYQPNDKGFLPWQCIYCGYWKTCWPKAEKVLVGRSYKLKIAEVL